MQSVLLDPPAEAGEAEFPFLEVQSELAQFDIVFENLEPLRRKHGCTMGNDCCCANPEPSLDVRLNFAERIPQIAGHIQQD